MSLTPSAKSPLPNKVLFTGSSGQDLVTTQPTTDVSEPRRRWGESEHSVSCRVGRHCSCSLSPSAPESTLLEV